MKLSTTSLVSTGTLGIAGLVAAGLMAYPSTASAGSSSDDPFIKRDEDTPELVLVADDDDDDTNARDNTNTRTRDNTGTRDNTRTNDNTGTGTRTGRDKSRQRQVRDLTNDGPGKQMVDRSARHTNDRSRHNTRR